MAGGPLGICTGGSQFGRSIPTLGGLQGLVPPVGLSPGLLLWPNADPSPNAPWTLLVIKTMVDANSLNKIICGNSEEKN